MLGVLIFDTLPGLIIGVADSLLLLLYRVSRPHVAVLGEIPGSGGQWADIAVHPEDQTVPGITVLRVESGRVLRQRRPCARRHRRRRHR